MAGEIAVAALVRKRAEPAGRVGHALAELDGMLGGLAALDATLRLFDPGIRAESIRPKRFRPPSDEPGPGIGSRDMLALLRRVGEPLDAREIAARLFGRSRAGRRREAAGAGPGDRTGGAAEVHEARAGGVRTGAGTGHAVAAGQ